jgi:hypothetical protein
MDIEDIMIEIPSISPRIHPPTNAFLNATLAPPLIASTPPVTNPETIALSGSSFCLHQIIRQSTAEKHPPHIAKLPNHNNQKFTYLPKMELYF